MKCCGPNPSHSHCVNYSPGHFCYFRFSGELIVVVKLRNCLTIFLRRHYFKLTVRFVSWSTTSPWQFRQTNAAETSPNTFSKSMMRYPWQSSRLSLFFFFFFLGQISIFCERSRWMGLINPHLFKIEQIIVGNINWRQLTKMTVVFITYSWLLW